MSHKNSNVEDWDSIINNVETFDNCQQVEDNSEYGDIDMFVSSYVIEIDTSINPHDQMITNDQSEDHSHVMGREVSRLLMKKMS